MTGARGENPKALTLRHRADLEFHSQTFGGKQYWIVKDPVVLRYFQFSPQEFAIFQWLDGRCSLVEVKARFESEFPPQQLTLQRLQSFVAGLHRSGLLISEGPDQARQLLARFRRQRREAWLNTFSNVLAIRFRGIDAEPMLDLLYPMLRWMFAPWFLLTCGLLIVSALVLVCTHADAMWLRLPDTAAFLNPRNLLWLTMALASTKILHELGHALTCKHFGGECHELGIMLLVFAPCLYCNVTDSWILRSRWQRIAISAAGIFVELVLASMCTWAWWFSHPGGFNTICLNVMVVCAVGTVLLNGNPLLRYDGYFILSDLLGMPNLWQRSRAAVGQWMGRLLGMDVEQAPIEEDAPALLMLYGVASMVYRVFVVFAILCCVYGVLVPIQLGVVAHAILAVVLAGLIIRPFIRFGHMISDPSAPHRINWLRTAMTSVLLAAAAAAFCLVPVPCRISAPVVVEPASAASVYVSVTGTLVQAVPAGQAVAAGDVLAELDDADLRRELAQLEGKHAETLILVNALQTLRTASAAQDVSAQLPVAREQLADIASRLEQKRIEQQQLSLRSPTDGTVIPAPRQPSTAASKSRLAAWTGTPLDPSNLGGTLETGTLFCLVGDLNHLQATLFVEETDVRHVQPGQRVHMLFDMAPGCVFPGTVMEIARRDLDVIPRELSREQEVAHRIDEAGLPRPLETAYQARVKLDDHRQPLLIGAQGRARVTVEPQTLLLRVQRLLRNTFGDALKSG